MRFSRFAAVALLVGPVATLLAAGASDLSGDMSGTSDLVTITAVDESYGMLRTTENGEEGNWRRRAREEFGIDFDVIDIAGDTNAMKEKLDLFIAAGDYPDVMWFRSNFYRDWALRGILQDIEQHLGKTQNYRARWTDEQWQTMHAQLALPDGKMYWYPSGPNPERPSFYWIYRKSSFDPLGLEPPQTTDEMLDVMDRLKAAHPEAVFGHRGRGNADYLYFFMTPTFRILTDPGYDPDTGEFVAASSSASGDPIISDKYRDLLKFVHRLYGDGHLNPARS